MATLTRDLLAGAGGLLAGAGDLLAGAGRAFDLILPPSCVGCGVGMESGAPPVCPLCWRTLAGLHPPWCPTCGVTRPRDPRLPDSDHCGECLGWDALRAAAPFRMDGMATRLVHALKFDGWRGLAPQMARAMVRPGRRLAMEEPLRLVPVPLSRARLRERGFNQAELLARGLADETGWALVNLLRRGRTGEQQARLGRRRRAANVQGQFEVDHGRRGGGTWSVLLVDDVVTTGATAAACAAALKDAGLNCAGVVSFARATQPIDARG